MASYWGNSWGLAWGNSWGPVTSGQQALLASAVLVQASANASALLELRLGALAQASSQLSASLALGARLESSLLVQLAAEAQLLKAISAQANPLIQVVANSTLSKRVVFEGFSSANALTNGNLTKQALIEASLLANIGVVGALDKHSIAHAKILAQSLAGASLDKSVLLLGNAETAAHTVGTASILQFVAAQVHIPVATSGAIQRSLNMAASLQAKSFGVADVHKDIVFASDVLVRSYAQALPYLGFTIAGSAAMSVSSAGDFSVLKRLTSQIQASTVASGYAVKEVNLYGDSSVLVSVEALPSLEFLLQGRLDTISDSSGQLAISKEFVTSVLASASIHGSLDTVLVFAGSGQVIVSLGGSLYTFQAVDGLYTLVSLDDSGEVVELDDTWLVEEVETSLSYSSEDFELGVVELIDDGWTVEHYGNSVLLSRMADSIVIEDEAQNFVEELDDGYQVELVDDFWMVEMLNNVKELGDEIEIVELLGTTSAELSSLDGTVAAAQLAP